MYTSCVDGTDFLYTSKKHNGTRNFFPMVQRPLMGQGLLIIKALRSHPDTPHSVEILQTSDLADAKIST